jgi:hypothetical protein
MHIQQQNRSATDSHSHASRPQMVVAVLLWTLAVPVIGPLFLVRAPLVLPSLSAIALASAAVSAFIAWCMSSEHDGTGISLWDISGAYAFIGFSAGMLSEPQHVLDLLSMPAETRSQFGSSH